VGGVFAGCSLPFLLPLPEYAIGNPLELFMHFFLTLVPGLGGLWMMVRSVMLPVAVRGDYLVERSIWRSRRIPLGEVISVSTGKGAHGIVGYPCTFPVLVRRDGTRRNVESLVFAGRTSSTKTDREMRRFASMVGKPFQP
jgi:hypothetical protein